MGVYLNQLTMSEMFRSVEPSAESEPEYPKLALFRAKYCDPDRPHIDLHDGEVVSYPTIHFYGRTDDKLIVLRSGIHEYEQLFWLGAYDLAKNEEIPFDVTSRETHVDPYLKYAVGRYDNLYELKSQTDETKTALFRMASHALEWTEDGISTNVIPGR